MATAPDYLAADRDRAGQINRAFREAGYSDALINWWWIELAQPQLEVRTAVQAWQQDYARVEDLARRYVAKGEEMRKWLVDAHAAVADRSILERIASQTSPQERLEFQRRGSSR